MLSLSTQCEQIYSTYFAQFKNLPPPMWLKQKKRSYRNRHPINQFLPLEIEIFGYLHKQADVFYTIMPIPFGA
jgi:hypothetical protein